MKRRLEAAFAIAVLAILSGCGQADQDKARARAAEARRKAHQAAAQARVEADKLAREAKQEARSLDRNIKDAVNGTGAPQSGGSQARQKLRQGGEDLKTAGSEAEVKLERAALITKVKAKLVNDVGLSTVSGVDVDATGHVITLRGTVSTPEQKQQAEFAVRQVNGVSKVINDLQVQQ